MISNSVYVFDLDGTLANVAHRLHHIKGDNKDWDAFYEECLEDSPIWDTIQIFKALKKEGYTVGIITGRSDQVVTKTYHWLMRHGLDPDFIRMRPEGNYKPDHELKYEMLLDAIEDGQKVEAIFEDRKKVVDMWRSKGITCYHVAEGDF